MARTTADRTAIPRATMTTEARRCAASTPTNSRGQSTYSWPSTDNDHRCSSGEGRANASE